MQSKNEALFNLIFATFMLISCLQDIFFEKQNHIIFLIIEIILAIGLTITIIYCYKEYILLKREEKKYEKKYENK